MSLAVTAPMALVPPQSEEAPRGPPNLGNASSPFVTPRSTFFFLQ